jgi:hypothetical protein
MSSQKLDKREKTKVFITMDLEDSETLQNHCWVAFGHPQQFQRISRHLVTSIKEPFGHFGRSITFCRFIVVCMNSEGLYLLQEFVVNYLVKDSYVIS